MRRKSEIHLKLFTMILMIYRCKHKLKWNKKGINIILSSFDKNITVGAVAASEKTTAEIKIWKNRRRWLLFAACVAAVVVVVVVVENNFLLFFLQKNKMCKCFFFFFSK